MPEVLEEITRDYDIDAIFANRWQGHGVCYCDSCRTNFKAASRLRPAARLRASRIRPGMAWTAWRRTLLTGSSSNGTR